MIRVRTGSRLHFGFFALPSSDPYNQASEAWGGLDLMINDPGLDIVVERTETWSAQGPLADRALEIAQTLTRELWPNQPLAYSLRIGAGLMQHVGLGTGTQLALAVGRALCGLQKQEANAADIARVLKRGGRSTIGIHGFQHGGFLVEATRSEGALAPLVVRHDFPPDWGVVLVIPSDLQGIHGRQEKDAFAQLRETSTATQTEALCRLTLLEILPSLQTGDLPRFGEALYDFNRRVGEMFRPWQGDVYSHPRLGELVARLRALGFHAVGQSSWGPALFAIARTDFIQAVQKDLEQLAQVQLVPTQARNVGAEEIWE